MVSFHWNIMDGKRYLILHLEILYARMSSTDNIKEIGIEYILFIKNVK